MPRWALALSATIVVAGMIVGHLGLTPKVSDRDRLVGLIADAEQAANQRDWARVLQHVADDYSDRSGLTRADLKRLALQASRSYEGYRVRATVQGLAVSDKGRATAAVDVTVSRPGETPETDRYLVTVTFEKRGRRWMIVSADGWQGEIGRETGE